MFADPDNVVSTIQFLAFVGVFSLVAAGLKFLFAKYFGTTAKIIKLKIAISGFMDIVLALLLCLASAILPRSLENLSMLVLVPIIFLANSSLAYLCNHWIYRNVSFNKNKKIWYLVVSSVLLPLELYGIMLVMAIR